jgi:putative nucleotidyltransferase with HDIG domain
MLFKKASARRQAIREDVAEAEGQFDRGGGVADAGTGGISGPTLLVAVIFFLVASAVQFWPPQPLPYREGDRAPMDLAAPVAFSIVNPAEAEQQRQAARAATPPVLVAQEMAFNHIHGQLSALKENVTGIRSAAQVPAEVQAVFPGLTDPGVSWLQSIDRISYERTIATFLNRGLFYLPVVSEKDSAALKQTHATEVKLTHNEQEAMGGWLPGSTFVYVPGGLDPREVQRAVTEEFPLSMVPAISNYILGLREPTFQYSTKLTEMLADRNAQQIPAMGRTVEANKVIVPRGQQITAEKYRELQAAQAAFAQKVSAEHPWGPWLSRLGRVLVVLTMTVAGALYISRLSRVTRTVRQAWTVGLLLLVTLVLAKVLVAVAPQSLYLLGTAPTLMATILLVIAYNQRFALGVAVLHGLLVTFTLEQGIGFYLPLLAGAVTFIFGLGEIRTRGKLIEVGCVASAVMFLTLWAVGLGRMVGEIWSPAMEIVDLHWVMIQSLWAAGAGLAVAGLVMILLPPIERAFSMTTAMTLLEWCDASKPLLRRLSQEAAGTFNHSLTVGIMAEAAGNAIGANGLLCRVGAYYHDVGKLSKPQYFIENQTAGGPNRHDKLSPAMSLLIIVGHVKDGIELAREYRLPRIVHQFIAQHHGTTLVEYFYHAARKRAEQEDGGAVVSDTEFRYPGPKPQTREAAIVMICDGCESAVRSIEEPTAGRIETMVHTMIMKRLMDGQFGECDLTLRDLSIIEETLVRTLAAIHHGRVAYPSSAVEGKGSDVGMGGPVIARPA